MIEETDGLTGAVIRSYIWLGLSPVATLGDAATGATRPLTYLHTDHLGKPVRATDTTGAVVWDGGVITPFGVQIATLGALTQPLLFPGQYQDAETGYAYNWHRTYDPDLGRYLQSDPIGLEGGINRYTYVGGNPMGYVDPTEVVGSSALNAFKQRSVGN